MKIEFNERQSLRVGIIGTGFAGRAHAAGYRLANVALDLPVNVVVSAVADVDDRRAQQFARKFGLEWCSNDWRDLLDDESIDIVSIAVPNEFHSQIALAALAQGKHVHCEKPLALSFADAHRMAAAAQASGAVTRVGFNYLANPLFREMKRHIDSQEIGDVLSFRGIHANGYMATGSEPADFRILGPGPGVLQDLGSHILATALYLLGPIESVRGEKVTVHHRRVSLQGEVGSTDDIARATLHFSSGATGTIEASWVATGRNMQHDFEIYGTHGAVHFSQERFSEYHLFLVDPTGKQRGFQRVEAGPVHFPYGNLCPAPGHQLGFNELKAIEMAEFVGEICGLAPAGLGFEFGSEVAACVEAIAESARDESLTQVRSVRK